MSLSATTSLFANTSTGRETDPLLSTSNNLDSVAHASDQSEPLSVRAGKTSDVPSGETFDNVPQARRRLGLFSATFLIFNRVIGSGIYATPSLILHNSGSVGVALLMWLAGASIAALGTTVYIELGTGLPRSGGEKNYLEYIYRRPKFLVSCVYISYALLTGAAASNSMVFGEYVIHSLGLTSTSFNTRFVAFLCLTFTLITHGVFLKFGVRLINGIGFFKFVILGSMAGSGIMCLLGVPGFALRDGYERPRNFEWDQFWEGSVTSTNSLVTALYNVIWCFIGYSNANYALSEIRDPVRTIKRAAPLAMLAVTTLYIVVNIAYFGVVSKADILASRRIAAALFFRNLFGPTTERALSVLIALSTLGNILAGQFSQGRLVQELGREGILPCSWFFASSKPFNAPLAGLSMQYIVSMAFVIVPPPGDAYHFLINVSSYSSAVINTLVSVGLLLLHTRAFRSWGWNPPFQAPKLVILLFVLSNVFLVVVPLVPPVPGTSVYERLPYWLHVAVSWGVSIIGVSYWLVWCVWLPGRNGYRLERRWVVQDDGVSRYVFQKVPLI